MDWTQLQAVAAVARHRSFSGAAAELGLTQPGVSRQVARLERELGVPLFVRGHEGVTPTPAGERVCSYAAEEIARRRQLEADLRGQPEDVAGELPIAASTTPGEFLVPGLLARFRERFPAVHARVRISDSAQVVEDVRSGQAGLGFVGARFPGRDLQYLPVAEDEVVLAVPAAHAFAGRGEVALADLAGEPFIDREGGSGTLLSVRRSLAARGQLLPPYRVVMELSTTQAILSAVERGYGVGWVSSLVLAGRGARVAAVRLVDHPLGRELLLVTAATHTPSPPVARFVEWLRNEPRAAP